MCGAVLVALAFLFGPASGSDGALWKVHDDVLPDNYLEHLKPEIAAAEGWRYPQRGSLIHGKAPTNWYGDKRKAPPRFYIEKVIKLLRRYALPEEFYPDGRYSADDIIGAEWWIQRRGRTEDIGFHYDKDEAKASLERRMEFPILSTITYLEDVGAPTLIFDQTTPDGNVDIPAIPEHALLVYPKANRHVVFRGNLNHGVVGELSRTAEAEGKKRITLLINWWYRRPMEPNTVRITNAMAASFGAVKTRMDRPEWNDHEQRTEPRPDVSGAAVALRPGRDTAPIVRDGRIEAVAGTRLTRIIVPPNEGIWFNLPELDHGALSESDMFLVTWPQDEIFGSVGILDTAHQQQMSSIFRSQQPKLYAFHGDRDGAAVAHSFLPVSQRLLGVVDPYIAPLSTSADAMRQLGVAKEDLPALVLHDTSSDRTEVRQNWSLSHGEVVAFVQEFTNAPVHAEL